MRPRIDGLLKEPKLIASGEMYPGRFTCHGVEWIVSGGGTMATLTVTAQEVADAAESRILWIDQDTQRGIKPGLPFSAPREISLADGYPDPTIYIFDSDKADEITERLLEGGSGLFLNPLVWSLRPGAFQAFWSEEKDLC